jgi:hypothetical protein
MIAKANRPPSSGDSSRGGGVRSSSQSGFHLRLVRQLRLARLHIGEQFFHLLDRVVDRQCRDRPARTFRSGMVASPTAP